MIIFSAAIVSRGDIKRNEFQISPDEKQKPVISVELLSETYTIDKILCPGEGNARAGILIKGKVEPLYSTKMVQESIAEILDLLSTVSVTNWEELHRLYRIEASLNQRLEYLSKELEEIISANLNLIEKTNIAVMDYCEKRIKELLLGNSIPFSCASPCSESLELNPGVCKIISPLNINFRNPYASYYVAVAEGTLSGTGRCSDPTD